MFEPMVMIAGCGDISGFQIGELMRICWPSCGVRKKLLVFIGEALRDAFDPRS